MLLWKHSSVNDQPGGVALNQSTVCATRDGGVGSSGAGAVGSSGIEGSRSTILFIVDRVKRLKTCVSAVRVDVNDSAALFNALFSSTKFTVSLLGPCGPVGCLDQERRIMRIFFSTCFVSIFQKEELVSFLGSTYHNIIIQQQVPNLLDGNTLTFHSST